MIGLLFSGQGAQKTGMTQDLYEQIPEYRLTINKASDILNIDLAKLLFDPDKQADLSSTRFCQPAILAVSYALYQLLIKNISFEKFSIGLSLGEYSALASSEAIDFKTVLQVIKRRGELMQAASEFKSSKMIAIMGADIEAVRAACKEASKVGVVSISNVNTPLQIVIGGEESAVIFADKLLKADGKKTMPLAVSGAFHTLMMQPVQAQLYDELKKVSWSECKYPVYSTTTQKKFIPQDLTANLTQQLVSPTYFAKTLLQHALGLNAVIEVGPGKTLVSFAHKTIPGLITCRLDSVKEFEKTITFLEKNYGFRR